MAELSSDTKKLVRAYVKEEFGKVKDTLLRSLVELMEKEYREVANYVQNKELKEAEIHKNIVVLEGHDEDIKPPPLQPKDRARTAEDELRTLLGEVDDEEDPIETAVPEAVCLENSIIDIGENTPVLGLENLAGSGNVDVAGNIIVE